MYNKIDTKDKILCSFLYAGIFIPFVTLAPIIWIVVANLRKIYLKEFIKYHCFQAVLFNMIIFFLPGGFDLLVSFLMNVFQLLVLMLSSMNFLEYLQISPESTLDMFTKFKVLVLSIYAILVKVLTLYAVIWTARGKYTYIPPLSQAVNQLLR